MAEEAAKAYGLPRDIPAELALVEEVNRSAGHVKWLGQQVASLDPDEVAESVLVQQYLRERRHLVDVSAKVAGLNLEERREQRAERQAAQLEAVLRVAFGELGLSVEQWARVPAALRSGTAALFGGGRPAIESVVAAAEVRDRSAAEG